MLISKYAALAESIKVSIKAVALTPSSKLKKAVVTIAIESANKTETPLELKSIFS